jgi:uncharacterized RDD family membrane protein YckC
MWLAVWIGFVITFVYFAAMDSVWGEGATVGKRLMGIEVVDSEGKYLTHRAATVRYAALLDAFFLTDLVGTSLPLLPTLAELLESVLFLGIVYFYVFGRSGRQPLHDVACRILCCRGQVTRQGSSCSSGERALENLWCPSMCCGDLLHGPGQVVCKVRAVSRTIGQSRKK